MDPHSGCDEIQESSFAIGVNRRARHRSAPLQAADRASVCVTTDVSLGRSSAAGDHVLWAAMRSEDSESSTARGIISHARGATRRDHQRQELVFNSRNYPKLNESRRAVALEQRLLRRDPIIRPSVSRIERENGITRAVDITYESGQVWW